MTDGESGILIAPVPMVAKFKRDKFNEGSFINGIHQNLMTETGKTKIHIFCGISKTIPKINSAMTMIAMAGIDSGWIYPKNGKANQFIFTVAE